MIKHKKNTWDFYVEKVYLWQEKLILGWWQHNDVLTIGFYLGQGEDLLVQQPETEEVHISLPQSSTTLSQLGWSCIRSSLLHRGKTGTTLGGTSIKVSHYSCLARQTHQLYTGKVLVSASPLFIPGLLNRLGKTERIDSSLMFLSPFVFTSLNPD